MVQVIDRLLQISNAFTVQDTWIISECRDRNIQRTKLARNPDCFPGRLDQDVLVICANPDRCGGRFYATPPPVKVCLNLCAVRKRSGCFTSSRTKNCWLTTTGSSQDANRDSRGRLGG